MAGSTAARYVRGGWTALVTEQGTALLHPSIDDEHVRGVWAALTEGAGVSGCLEVLAAGGLSDLPSFALVQHGSGELRVLVRGEVRITAGEQVVGATGIATWREALVPAESYRITVADDGAAGLAWPLSAGVVLASEIEWLGLAQDVTGAAQAGAAAAEAAAGGSPAAAAVDGGGSPVEEAPAGSLVAGGVVAGGAAPAVAEPVEPVADQEAGADADADSDVDPDVAGAEDAAGDPAGTAAEEAPADGAAQAEASDAVERAEVSDAVEQAEVEQIEAVAAEAVQAADAAEQETGSSAPAVEETQVGDLEEPATAAVEETQVGEVPEEGAATGAPSLDAEGGEIIDSLPWAVGTADRDRAAEATGGAATGSAPPAPQTPGSQPPAPPAAGEDDLPEHTVLSPRGPNATAAAAAAASSTPVPPWQPPVDMSRPSGPVPPYGQGDVDIDGDHDGHTVMVSELPKDQDMTIVPGLGDTDLYDEPGQVPAGTPALSLSVSTGAEVPLDRPVLIGRAPESSRFSAGVQPRLVTVPSPQQDISRTHVEVRAEGGSAVVTDLNSTNGTVLVQPGTPPRRLHAGEGASVPAGTLIDLGDGVTVSVHPTDQAAR